MSTWLIGKKTAGVKEKRTGREEEKDEGVYIYIYTGSAAHVLIFPGFTREAGEANTIGRR